jgi:predicted AlkP superfamily phosphohydrolase/phosphomutase
VTMRPGGVLVIGLDGGSPDVLVPLGERGVMPTFRRLVSEGRHGILRSTIPWYTVPGWASLMTGVGPSTHGLLHWVHAGQEEYFEHHRRGRRFLTSQDLPFPTFWDIAGAAGLNVAVVNMPLTFPAWPVNGTMITGLLTPSSAIAGTCHPSGLLQRFPDYRVDLSTSREGASPDALPIERDSDAAIEELLEVTAIRGRVAAELLAEDVDLGVVVFVGPDRVSHKAWSEQIAVAAGHTGGSRTERLVEAYYRGLDDAISRLLDAAGPDITVMVVADHGFGPPAERVFAANAWLRERGYLSVRAAGVQAAVASRPGLARLARPLFRSWRRRRSSLAEPGLVDWSRSAVYAVGYPHTRTFGLVLNRKGVKREGWVAPEDAPAILTRLERDLRALADEEGRPVVRRVIRTEELGPVAPSFPDLIVETEAQFFPLDGLLRKQLFGRFALRSGLHERDGIFAVWGPRVQGQGRAEADILDVAPTVLGLLGIEGPAHLEGKVRDDLLELPQGRRAPPVVHGPRDHGSGVSSEERGEIEAHLRALGYAE